MTNEEIIRSIPLRDLASITIRHKYSEDIDYDYDEEPFSWGVITTLVTSDGFEFDKLDYEEALEHEIWWLKQEAVAFVEKHD